MVRHYDAGRYTPEPMKFEYKDPVVEAVKLDNENIFKVSGWCGGLVSRKVYYGVRNHYLLVPSLNGSISVEIGDWLVKDSRNVIKVYTEQEFRDIFKHLQKKPSGFEENTRRENS